MGINKIITSPVSLYWILYPPHYIVWFSQWKVTTYSSIEHI